MLHKICLPACHCWLQRPLDEQAALKAIVSQILYQFSAVSCSICNPDEATLFMQSVQLLERCCTFWDTTSPLHFCKTKKVVKNSRRSKIELIGRGIRLMPQARFCDRCPRSTRSSDSRYVSSWATCMTSIPKLILWTLRRCRLLTSTCCTASADY